MKLSVILLPNSHHQDDTRCLVGRLRSTPSFELLLGPGYKVNDTVDGRNPAPVDM